MKDSTFSYRDDNVLVTKWIVEDGFLLINRAEIAVPEAKTDLVYNAQEQIGVSEGEGYEITGHKGTDARTYQATANVDKNHT